jgi:hypothetical protein
LEKICFPDNGAKLPFLSQATPPFVTLHLAPNLWVYYASHYTSDGADFMLGFGHLLLLLWFTGLA